jgi:HAD superfamily hydrolase (TIGR01509 family)
MLVESGLGYTQKSQSAFRDGIGLPEINIDLVIFDCDGVLIDSEIIACRVDAEELTALGIPMTTEEVVQRFTGISQKDMRATIERDAGWPLPPNYEAHVAQRARDLMSKELRAIPGVRRLLERLGIPFCVASSSTHEKLRFTLTLTGLYDPFAPNIFSSSEVARGKPAPDLFLNAANRMNAAPARCVVIEDSAAGVEATVAAGMHPIGFVGGAHCDARLADRLQSMGAKLILQNLEDLPRAISDSLSLPLQEKRSS